MTMMAGAARHSRSSELSAKAEQALSSGDVFEAERLMLKSLLACRAEHDFERMAAIVPHLMEARMRRLKNALAVKRIAIIDTPVSEDVRASKGCFLVQPPQVAADARRLRLAAFEQQVSVAVLCREPLTKIKLLPIVALGPGSTLRTKVQPPRNFEKPDMAWFIAAIDALGTFAVESLDPSLTPMRRVDALLDRLDALPEHESLHHALQQACLEARIEYEQARASKAARKGARPAEEAEADDAGALDDDLDDASIDQ
jgi:hypothetical protein